MSRMSAESRARTRDTIPAPPKMGRYPAKDHARRVAKELGTDHGLIYLQATREDGYNELKTFSQDRYFYYLSGCNEMDFHITYDIASDQLNMYLPNYGTSHIYFYGTKNTIKDALETYDVDGAAYDADLSPYIEKWSKKYQDAKVYLLRPDLKYASFVNSTIDCLRSSTRTNDSDLEPAIVACRVIKDHYEIRLIKHANTISAKAHTHVLRKINSYTNERQIEAKFVQTCINRGAKTQAYSPIVAAGINAATMHYTENNADLGDNKFVLIDAAAEFENYAADVTRTFPLNGHWPSAEAKDIYLLVQRMQTAAVSTVKPGSSAEHASQAAIRHGVEGLLDLGILHQGSVDDILRQGTLRAFFPTALGHHIGLDVHDVAPPDCYVGSLSTDDSALPEAGLLTPYSPTSLTTKTQTQASRPKWSYATYRPGMTLAIEPGIYFNRFVLESVYLPDADHARYINMPVVEKYLHVGGVRIEDNFLVTEHGHECLTTAPKGEAAMRIIRGEDRA